MCARDNDDELEDEFETRIQRQGERIEKARADKGRSFWSYLGLIGVVGWSVVVPMVVGAVIGLALDHKFETGSRWTFGLMVFGLGVGCFNAWRLITREH